MPIGLARRLFNRRPRPTTPFPWEEVFDSMGDGLVVLDSGRRLVGINPAAERLIGLSAEGVLGFLVEEVFSESRSFLGVLLPALEETRTWTLRDLSWQNNQTEIVHTDLSLSPLVDAGGEASGWVLIFRDLSPVKGLEEEVRKSDRLAIMGTIAAGLAHEIKNPLGGIKGAAQLLQRQSHDPDQQGYLDIIIRESERVDRLIGDLLMFARPRPTRRTGCNLNEILNAVLASQEGLLDRVRVVPVREFDPSLPPVLGDGDQLTQVFLNFVKNAIEAMDGSERRLTVRTRLNTEFRIRVSDEKRGVRMAVVEVEDTGQGISEEDRLKVFTPFFTTKQGGSGLGMAIAQRIVQEHQGVIRLSSAVGKGTKVQVFLRSLA